MKKQLFTATSLLITGLFVASCGGQEQVSYFDSSTPGTATIKIYKNNQSTSKNRYVAPKNVTIKNTYQSLSGILDFPGSFFLSFLVTTKSETLLSTIQNLSSFPVSSS